ncbi:transposon Tf2-1 polyprotein isoform X1 [Cucumis melo var. makuwa]|uniref:Transposon Tf2-1 polyprotein isoform X1 n=1 Tax=Cucumis melo var. makuwa TaxID=1194695 RepID=A0A5D3DZ68_CUCMM|nr:transposon Tf2-1 polyprotein isoform X1 [Cucumis melo var. makuwa]
MMKKAEERLDLVEEELQKLLIIEDLSLLTKSIKEMNSQIDKHYQQQQRNRKNDEDKPVDWSKFKKVEMPVFNGTNPNSWLLKAGRFFKIHDLPDSEKLTMAVISFDGPGLDWSITY